MSSIEGIDREFVLSLLEDLVRTNSVNPTVGRGPGESALSDLICDRLASIGGLDVQKQPVSDGRSNVIAILTGSGGGRDLMLNGHMDTVGAEGMTIEPFRPFIDNGKLHGRGACDMKGALAAMIGAVKCLVDSGSSLRGDLIFTAVVDEEYRSLGTRKLVEDYTADAAIVGEPTEMKVAIAHKGFVWIEIETKGRAAHGSVPEKEVDAITHAAKVVSALDKLQRRLESRAHPLLGSAKIHTSMIEGGTNWSIIPDRCVLKLERRTLPAESTGSVMEEIEEILRDIKRETDNFEATARNVYDMPPLETPSHEPIVRLLQEILVDTTGRRTSLVGVPYWTDGALLSRLASIPTCLYGPGDIGVAHSADEYVNVEDVLRSAQVYRAIVQKFCV